ncbi:MAG: sigma-70 family RNA polymerase sigma factor [Myxococcales bacterium]|nr:sigma-70 family RNA polymerase sigma factor [Myxococcales bacterium]MCB9756249.1 sigma-70 family RNA polymerase sigma factor [Myxococcales bacterium]
MAMISTTSTLLPEYSALYQTVRSILRMRGRGLHSADIDDIAQTVMEKILRASARGKGPSQNARAWVKRIAHNEHVNWVRRRGRTRECALDAEVSVDAGTPTTTDTSHTGATVVFLRDVEGLLTTRQREVVRMFSSGYTGQEIANTLGLSPALISLEKKSIRQTLTEQGYHGQRAARPRARVA